MAPGIGGGGRPATPKYAAAAGRWKVIQNGYLRTESASVLNLRIRSTAASRLHTTQREISRMNSSLYAHKITKTRRQGPGSFRDNVAYSLSARLGTLACISIRRRVIYSEHFAPEAQRINRINESTESVWILMKSCAHLTKSKEKIILQFHRTSTPSGVRKSRSALGALQNIWIIWETRNRRHKRTPWLLFIADYFCDYFVIIFTSLASWRPYLPNPHIIFVFFKTLLDPQNILCILHNLRMSSSYHILSYSRLC